MKKSFYLFSFLLLIFFDVNAQLNTPLNINTHFGEKCHTDKNHHELYQNDANYRQNFDAAQNQVHSIINSGVRTGGVYTIPVVVHVMHLGSPVGTDENISDAQIQSAIDNLNDAYANIGYNGLDIEIQFALAVRDPYCNATNGINRINASGLISGGDAYATKGATDNNRTALKALSNWNNSDYYNIWVVTEIDDNNGGAGTQGYAYFPGAANGTDGTVILYNAFGYDPNGLIGYELKPYTRYNATTIHELGHAFNLYHTFEGDDINDDGTPDTCPSISAGAGDECGDTDAHRRDDSDCDVIQATCNGVIGSDVFNNFMAYSSDECQDRFTADQKTRMRAAVEGPRVSLTTSLGLTPAPSQAPNTLAISCSPVSSATGLGGGFGGIMSVTYGNKTNTTSNTPNDGISYGTDGYLDFSSDCLKYLEVNEGDNIPISITTWFNNHNIKIYVDWNHDGEFNETDELALTLSTIGTANSGNNMASGNIVMPGSVTTNEYLRLRFNADIATPTGYCDGPTHGQVEDYSIYINPSGPSVPVADFSANSTSVCTSTSVTFTDASTDATGWSWNFGSGASPATATGQGPHAVSYSTIGNKTVTLDVTGPGGNDNETKINYITVSGSVTPAVSISSNQGTTICSGTSVTFTATPTNGGTTPSYQWKLNGGNVGSNSSSYNNSSLVNGDDVSCLMTSNASCASPVTGTSNTISMTVNPSVTPTVSIAASANPISSGDPVTFTATPTNGGAAPSYQWKLNGGNVGSNSNTYNNSSLVNGDQVSCVLTSNATCPSPVSATSNIVIMTVNSGSCTNNTAGPGGVGNQNETELWFDASYLNLNNNNYVSTWDDRSGNNNNASQVDNSKKPRFYTNYINSKAAVNFDGANDWMETSSISDLNTSNLTWTVVCKADYFSTGHVICSGYSNGAGAGSHHAWKTASTSNNSQYISLSRNLSGSAQNNSHGNQNGFQIITAVWDGSTDVFSGYTNGTLTGVKNNVTANPTGHISTRLGSRADAATQFFNGQIAEVIVYSKTLNDAERIIVDNYLGAKYNLPLSANDIYSYEATHGNDAAGIGMANGNSNLIGRGDIVEISNASTLANDDFLMFAHDGSSTSSTTIGAPAAYNGTGKIMQRNWRVDKTNDVGTVTISFYLDGIATGSSTDFELLKDSDGNFTNATRITSGFSYDSGCDIATWTGVNFSDGDYFTIGNPDGQALLFSPVNEQTLEENNLESNFETLEIVNNETKKVELKLFPNPTTGIVNIENKIEGASIRVVNTLGQILYHSKINMGSNQFEFSEFSPGIYFVQLINDRGESIIISQLMINK